MGFIIVPWKNSTVVKWRLNKPSNSKSGGFLSILFIDLKLDVQFDCVCIVKFVFSKNFDIEN